jgi:pyruvate,water dikinase
MVAAKLIYGFDELGKEHNGAVGKKCANLGELTKGGFRVPPGFALSLDAYKKFLTDTGVVEEIRRYLDTFSADPSSPEDMAKFEEVSKVIRGIVESTTMPTDMKESVISYYNDLCQKTGIVDVPVAVRSAGALSHPGQYETFHYVRGESELLQNIIKVWSSTYNARSLIARARGGFSLEFDPIGVGVVTMVNSFAAGVMFTLDPVTGDNSVITIDASFGIGESVVSGKVIPDQFLVDKIDLKIVERKINRKEIQYVRNATGQGLECVEIDEELKDKPALDDVEIRELAETGKSIEAYYGQAMDIEWAIEKDTPLERGVVQMLQARPETVWSKRREEMAKSESDLGSVLLENLLKGR